MDKLTHSICYGLSEYDVAALLQDWLISLKGSLNPSQQTLISAFFA